MKIMRKYFCEQTAVNDCDNDDDFEGNFVVNERQHGCRALFHRSLSWQDIEALRHWGMQLLAIYSIWWWWLSSWSSLIIIHHNDINDDNKYFLCVGDAAVDDDDDDDEDDDCDDEAESERENVQEM